MKIHLKTFDRTCADAQTLPREGLKIGLLRGTSNFDGFIMNQKLKVAIKIFGCPDSNEIFGIRDCKSLRIKK